MSKELEKQRAYIREQRNVDVPCPHCRERVNINDAMDALPDEPFNGKCPKCGGAVKHQLGLLGGSQWLDKAD